jgi:two-component system sensor histidine kinase UhpB
MTPVAAAGCPTLAAFLNQVSKEAARLARWNVSAAAVLGAVDTFAALLEKRWKRNFAPAREQLQLVTVLAIKEAYYQEAAAERARNAIEMRRMAEQARHSEEEERHRIGRELHDEAGQSLLMLRLQLEMMERNASPELAVRLADARGTVESIVTELRQIVSALSPAPLERLGLAAALRHLLARFRKTHQAVLRTRIAVPERLPRKIEEVVYRVAQESLQNVAKHSRATRVNLWLTATDKIVRLRVSDNGKGFRPAPEGGNQQTFGLTGMRDRAALLGGSLQLRSAPGKGTAIVLSLPRIIPE